MFVQLIFHKPWFHVLLNIFWVVYSHRVSHFIMYYNRWYKLYELWINALRRVSILLSVPYRMKIIIHNAVKTMSINGSKHLRRWCFIVLYQVNELQKQYWGLWLSLCVFFTWAPSFHSADHRSWSRYSLLPFVL